MVNIKALFYWVCRQGYNYNLFMLEEDDYDDNNEPKDPVIILKHQKLTTWLYIFLLIVSFYILFYINLLKPQPRIEINFDITLIKYNQLYLDHATTLSCPCSIITAPYKYFVSNTITFHPVCSSIFISEQWIKGLYLINASRYGVTDFRTTASSQFKLLSNLCSISQDTVNQSQTDFNNTELVTINLLPDVQIQSEVNATISFFKNSVSTQIISFLNYIRAYTQANYLVSALNTNIMFSTYTGGDQYTINKLETKYVTDTIDTGSTGAGMVCGTANPTSPAGFFSNQSSIYVFTQAQWSKPTANSQIVKGFFGGCTPLEALLPSTLDCLYDIECLQLLSYYFPALNQMDLNWTDLVLSSNQHNISVSHYLLNLFIEDWSTKMNYSKYFDTCAPSYCSYTSTDPINLSYAVTLVISLYGGLIIIFRLIAPFLIKIFFKFKHSLRSTNIDSVFQNIRHASKFFQWMKQLNLFKMVDKRSENNIKQQRITTRLYLILLTGSFMVLLFFVSLSTGTVTITISNPSLITYNNLQVLYSNTLRCPCSTTAIPYQKFVSLSPVLHQVCSSDFVTDRWLSIMEDILDLTFEDWRNRAYSQFHLLSELCRLANNTINDALHRFLLQSFIASSILPEFYFNTQLNTTLNQLFQLTINSFGSVVDTTRLLTQVDQPYMGTISTQWQLFQDNNFIAKIVINEMTDDQSLQAIFKLSGPRYDNLTFVNCICATNPHCQTPVAIYGVDHVWDYDHTSTTIIYIVPGSIAGCSTITSLLLSELQCFYSDADCFSVLMNYIRESYFQNIEYPLWFDVHPLVYNPMLSRYPPNTSISTIVKQMMVEQWNPSYSYNRFYELCAPNYCTYSHKIHTHTITGVIIILISMIGGLTVSLRIITPPLITFILNLLTMITKRRQEQQQSDRRNIFDRVKIAVQDLFKLLYNTAVTFNIFSVRNFGSNVNRLTAKRLGRWATRLHAILFIIGIGILTLYTIVRPQTLIKTIDKPSFNLYNHLKEDHGDTLECTCSLIASTFDQFVTIEAVFHEICTSPFVSDQWSINVTTNLISDLSIYEQKDYRRFISAHLQFLQGLCQLAIQSINDSINQFLISLFITMQLLSEKDFRVRLNSLIEQRKSIAPKTFSHLFFLIRNINHGNAIVSTYGTNFEYISPWYQNDISNYLYIPSQAIIYDNNCSCGLYPNCTIQASFIKTNSSENIPINGLKMGCTPSESFRVSTLECFYNESCIDLIQQYTNPTNQINSINKFPIPLSITTSRFLMNTTIAELIDNLFVEQWITTINYSSYFQQCLPLLCSYTYIQQFNLLYTITLLLGLHGGLTIVLKWICPKIIRIIEKIYKIRKKRLNIVEPSCSLEMTSNEIVNMDICNPISFTKSLSTNIPSETNILSPSRRYFKIVLMCLLLSLVMIALVLLSIFVAQIAKNKIIFTTSSTTIITSTITNTIIKSTTTAKILTSTTITQLSICQPKFQQITNYTTGSMAGLKSPVIADFNGDDLLDIVFFNYNTKSIHVLIGNGDGTFRADIKSWVGPFTGSSFIITVSDFNNDNQLDLAFTAQNVDYIYIMIGYGNATFSVSLTIFMGYDIHPRGITTSHFNNDNYSDIVVANQWHNNIGILLGYGNGSFSALMTYYTERNSNPSSIVVADFNRDGYQDIAVSNFDTRCVGVFLGYGNGSFKEQKTSFTGGYYYPTYITVGDFNDDHQPDVVFSYNAGKNVGMFFGYGNGTMGALTKIFAGNRTSYPRIAVGDFNNDGHLDITVGLIKPYSVCVLSGHGNGNFEAQIVFSTGLTNSGYLPWADVADFNDDGCQDILTSDDKGALSILLNTCHCQTTRIFETSTFIHS